MRDNQTTDQLLDLDHEPARSPARMLLWLVVAATVLRALAASAAPLLDDEAYYWIWSRHLDWSYLDHPPVIAYLIYLTTRFGDDALWVRLGPLVLGVATTYGMFLLGQELFDAKVGLRTAVLFQTLPILAGGAMLASPDAPLFLAWTLALRFAWQAIQGRSTRWMAAGLAIGFGMLSKLQLVFLVIGIVLFLVLHRPRSLAHWGPYAGAALAGLLFVPVIYWNNIHHWAMARFILYERPTVLSGISGVLDLIVRQLSFAALLFPVLIFALVFAWRHRADQRYAYLFWTALPSVAIPVLFGFVGASRGTWLGTAYLGLVVVVGTFWNRVVSWATGITAAVLAYALLVPLVPGLPIPTSEELYGWQEVADRVQLEARLIGGRAAIMADRYEAASLLAYYTRERLPVVLFPCPNPASVWPRPSEFGGTSAVTAIDARWNQLVPWARYFARISEAPRLTVQFHAQPRTFRIFRLDGFMPESACRAPGR